MFDLKEHPHKRMNILTGEWILVSPHRSKRPWQGKVESLQKVDRLEYDSECYLCPGNKRSDGSINVNYKGTNSFINDFSALLQDTPHGQHNINNLLIAESEKGICKVITFSERHDLTLPELVIEQILNLINLWCSEFESLAANHSIKNIQIFENKGDVMGCSNPHPHGQIWAQSSIPQEIIKETTQQKLYLDQHGTSLLGDYIKLELEIAERVVEVNEHFVAVVPYWAVWPFETLVVSKRNVQYLTDFNDEEKLALADILKKLTTRYDNIFDVSFPYSAGMHQAPVNDGAHLEWHWHMHFYPPLLRSAAVKKFMVGYEMLANAQRDITAECAAEKIRNVSTVHYKQATLHGQS